MNNVHAEPNLHENALTAELNHQHKCYICNFTTKRKILLNITKQLFKARQDTQDPPIFFFTLLVMSRNYKPPCIFTIKMVTM